MGCPQSKSESKDLSHGNGNNENVSRTRNDAIRPEERVPAKQQHDTRDHDDPKTTVRTGDVFIPEPTEDTENKKQDKESDKKAAVEENIKNEELATKSHKHDKKAKPAPKDVDIKVKPTPNDADVSFASVFIPDETLDDDQRLSNNTTPVANETNNTAIDMADIDIGQGISELTMDNQTISETGNEPKASKGSEGKEKIVKNADSRKTSNGTVDVNEDKGTTVNTTTELQTEDGYTYSENNTRDSRTPSVRYQNKDKIEYGLPEGVPKPGPPKSRKKDIIKPTTFTIVDKLVEQAPDDAFSSFPKMAAYLSGDKKKSELEVKSDDTDDDIGAKNLPPPRPTKTKKNDIITGTNMFRNIDEHARNSPEILSVDKLANQLCSVAESDIEKVRAFYFWICHNISYVYEKDNVDVASIRFDAVSTLRQGQGSFVTLFSALCKELSIPVVTIQGASKGIRHHPDKEFKLAERNHSWNAVHVNDEWHFVDCTWGSGFLDNDGKFRRKFDEFWFLTDPEIFAYDHFPTHSIWQLLDQPIDIDEFNKKPSLTEKSRELGLKLISHREPIVYFENEVAISFGTETFPLSNITADLRNEDGEELNRHRCISRIDENTFEVRVVPPEAGEYTLLLYGKAKDYRHAKFRKLMEYTLRCKEVYTDHVIFPNHLKAWGPEPNYAELGFAESIEKISFLKSETSEMTITLDQTKNIPVTQELKTDIANDYKDFTMITAKENCKIIHVRFPASGYYKLDIYAEGKNDKFEYAGSFLLQGMVSDKPKAFPKCNVESISKYACEVLEPMESEIPADSIVTFRLRSSVLKKAMVGIPMEEDYGLRLKGIGELSKQGDVFSAQIKTPKKGETILLSGAAAPPNVIWSRLYEFVTV